MFFFGDVSFMLRLLFPHQHYRQLYYHCKKIRLKKALPSFIYAIFLLLLCTILLTLPGSAFPKENWLDKIWFDKWVHIGMFGMLVTVWCWSASKVVLSRTLKRLFVFIAVLFFGYG